jgi:hypothetical protein
MSLSIVLGVLDAAVHEEKYAPETEVPLFRPERVKKNPLSDAISFNTKP